jgi:hypothetical protein
MICFSQGFLIKILFNYVDKGTVGACSGGNDMKRTVSELTLIAALLMSVVTGAQAVKGDSQTGAPFFSGIDINSPSNSTYSSRLPTLNVSVTTLGGSNLKISMNYSLDGSRNQTIPTTIQYPTGNSFMLALHTGLADLPALPEGSHNITVYVEYEYPNHGRFVNEPDTITAFYDSTVYFTISTDSEQEIPEFTSWLILPLTMMATLIATAMKRKRL